MFERNECYSEERALFYLHPFPFLFKRGRKGTEKTRGAVICDPSCGSWISWLFGLGWGEGQRSTGGLTFPRVCGLSVRCQIDNKWPFFLESVTGEGQVWLKSPYDSISIAINFQSCMSSWCLVLKEPSAYAEMLKLKHSSACLSFLSYTYPAAEAGSTVWKYKWNL